MLWILGEHVADKIGQNWRQALTASDGHEIAKLELAVYDRCVVETVHGLPAECQGDQKDTESVDVVGDAAVASGGGMTHRGVGGLAHGGLVHRGRGRPGGTYDGGAVCLAEENVVGSNGAVRQATHLKLLQDICDRPQHVFDKHQLRAKAAGRRPRTGRPVPGR
jgi:hypothetical protein